MNKLPLISIIIPCYNASKYIGETIESILVQSHNNFELIIVDDGSTDDSAKIIKMYNDKRIQYIYQQNKGTCAATNHGLSKANGQYIKFFDADDIMNEQHLEAQLARIDNRTDVLVSCKWGRFYNDEVASLRFKPESVWKDMSSLDWLRAALIQRNDMMPAWLWLIPRQIIERAGTLNEELTLNNDFEFSVRLLLEANEVLFSEQAEVYYRSGNRSSLTWVQSEKAFRSALLATDLGCSHLLKADTSDKMKELCADRYKEWLFALYPQYPDLQKVFEQRIQSLGGSKRKMEGGVVFRILSFIAGWRFTKRLRLYLNKKGYRKLPFN